MSPSPSRRTGAVTRRGPNAADRHIGARLGEARRRRGIEAAAMEADLGLVAGTLGRYEEGRRAVPAGELPGLAQALGVTVGFFFEGLAPFSPATPVRTAGRALGEEARRFLGAYREIPDPDLRRRLRELILSVADDTSSA